jgi:hypothetical protein
MKFWFSNRVLLIHECPQPVLFKALGEKGRS